LIVFNRRGRNLLTTLRSTIALCVLLAALPVNAQTRPSTTGEKAQRIATQPARDVGIMKREIPPILIAARANAYDRAGTRRCGDIDARVQELDAALGPDFDSDRKDKFNTAGNLAVSGVEGVVNSVIPFRGLVREVSGAANVDRRYAAAVVAGATRRGWLKGMATVRGCKLSPYREPPKKADAKADPAADAKPGPDRSPEAPAQPDAANRR
jgi:hypothetical protein